MKKEEIFKYVHKRFRGEMERYKYLLMQIRAKRKKEAKDNLIKIDLWSIEQCSEILLNNLQSLLFFVNPVFLG